MRKATFQFATRRILPPNATGFPLPLVPSGSACACESKRSKRRRYGKDSECIKRWGGSGNRAVVGAVADATFCPGAIQVRASRSEYAEFGLSNDLQPAAGCKRAHAFQQQYLELLLTPCSRERARSRTSAETQSTEHILTHSARAGASFCAGAETKPGQLDPEHPANILTKP